MTEILPVDVANVLADPMDSPEDRVLPPDPRSTDDDDGHLEADDWYRRNSEGAP